MGEQGGTNRSRLGARGSFERVGPLTLQREETREQEGEKRPGERERGDKGKILCFCLGERACCKSSKGFSNSERVSFSCFSSSTLNN